MSTIISERVCQCLSLFRRLFNSEFPLSLSLSTIDPILINPICLKFHIKHTKRPLATMARTRSQARAQNRNGPSGVNPAPRPRYYDENDSSDESETTEEGNSDDEYRPQTPRRQIRPTAAEDEDEGEDGIFQTPHSLQVSEQNLTLPRGPLRVVNSNSSSLSYHEALTSQQSDSTDSNETITQQESPHEEVTLQEEPSSQRFFFEDELMLGPPSFMDLTRLEFFQTFPHDPASTLCRRHFLQLAQSWHMRRQGHTENMIHSLNEEFPYSGVGPLLNHARDRQILAQAAWDEPWRGMEQTEFMTSLEQHLNWAEVELREQRRSAIANTGIPPRCDLEKCGLLSCGYCIAMANEEGVNLYQAIREARAQTWHGAWQDGDTAAFEEHQRRRMDALDLGDGLNGHKDRREIEMGSAYVSVGGLHFIVDVCNGETMIRFQ